MRNAINLLILTGSYRKNGNTAAIATLLEKETRKVWESDVPGNLSFHSEIISLAHENLRFCRGCRTCFDRGEDLCPLKDGLLRIREKINAADFLILASPVYVEDVSGVMKNWIDRMSFVCHRPEYFGKAAFVLSTSAIGSTSHTLGTMSTALRAWGFSVFGRATFVTGALTPSEELSARYGAKLSGIAKTLVKDYMRGRQEKPSFISLVIFKVQQIYYKTYEKKGSHDHSYWNERGWLENGAVYYTPFCGNPLKTALARFIGVFVSRFVLK